jgi:hypothetical protein
MVVELPDTASGGRGAGRTTGYANWWAAAAVRAAIEVMGALSRRQRAPPMRLPGVFAGAPRTGAGAGSRTSPL